MNLKKKKEVKQLAANIMGADVANFTRYRKGDVNHNYSFFIDDKKYMMKVPQVHVVNGKTEAKAYKHFFKNVKTDTPYGIVIRPGINGATVSSGDVRKLKSLQTQINKLRRSSIKSIPSHDGLAYDKHAYSLNIKDYMYFKSLVKRYSKETKVFSHNDINGQNVIGDGKRIHLIDFEGATMNSYYFDAASFYISSGIKLHTKNETKFDKYIFMTLCYFIMGSHDMPQTKKVKKLRKRYLKLMKNKPGLS